MKIKKTMLALFLVVSVTAMFSSCGGSDAGSGSDSGSGTDSQAAMIENYDQDSSALTFSNAKWEYDSTNDVYYRIGISYCAKPEAEDYETMGIYVPGKYMTGKKNSDGTYTCTPDKDNKIEGYTAATAPVVFPVNTPGYSSQQAPTSYDYSSVQSYIEAGYIYVCAGLRGRDSTCSDYSGAAPWGVTDLKAAVRYYRFNSSKLPGDTDSIFTFGHSGGGAQSAVTGASGDSSLYYDYLTTIGAAMYDKDKNYISDAICGAMCWCPITSLDQADEAYEWNMGQFSSSGTRADSEWTSLLSDDLAKEYASYINDLKLKDSDGSTLSLEKSKNGIYLSGSYYDYMLGVVQTSLNNFLKDTEFPYTAAASQTNAGMTSGSSSAGGGMPSGDMPSGDMPSGSMPGGSASGGSSGGTSNSTSGSGSADGSTYKTAADYVDYLNSDETWVKYDESSNTVTVKNLKGFVDLCKTATKDVGAFDDLSRSQAENAVFGTTDETSLHFDANMAKILSKNKDSFAKKSGWKSSYVSAYKKDLTYKDAEGNSIAYRVNMYNPMYYICDYYKGNDSSTPAKYWRINTGIEQGDTALTTETNLALALEQKDSVKDVSFTTVWAQGHTQAERTGSADANFIKWINKCLSK